MADEARAFPSFTKAERDRRWARLRSVMGELIAEYLAGMLADGRRIAVAGLHGGMYTLVRQPEGIANHSSVGRIQAAVPKSTVVDGTPVIGEGR
jgi:hypothetical protein